MKPNPSRLELQDARARSQTYELLGRLILQGLTGDVIPQLRALPELSSTLPDPFDADEAAADHYHLFGFNVFPFQSIFLDNSCLLGGQVTESVLNCYQQAGFPFDDLDQSGGESPDHIGIEFSYLAFLSTAEALARESDSLAEVDKWVERQRQFLEEHLLRWLPALMLAVQRQAQPFYESLATFALAFVAQHSAGLSAKASSLRLPSTEPTWPGDDPSLSDIASTLLTPIYSGIYLSRDDIGRLARAHQLPRGFGNRRQMLMNLLRSATTYESLGQLYETMADLVAGWADAYEKMNTKQDPAIYPRFWCEGATDTATRLRRLAKVSAKNT